MTGMDLGLNERRGARTDVRSMDQLSAIHQVPEGRLLTTVSTGLLAPYIKTCQVLRDQGKNILATPEDSLAIAPGRMGGALRFAVADGVSGAYTTPPGPGKYRGVSGGRAVSEAFTGRVRHDGGKSSLAELLRAANEDVAAVNQNVSSFVYGDLSTWAGTTGAILELHQGVFRAVVWGDARLILENKRGEVFISKDGLQAHEHDVEPILQGMIKGRMESGMSQADARREAWKEYMPIFRQTRRERINADADQCGFALLNGQPTFLSSRFVEKQNGLITGLRRAILITDGCILREECNKPGIGEHINSLVKKGGLEALIEDTRNKERGGATQHSHVTHAEAVGIAIEFR